MNQRSGFTILELSVVLALMALLAGVATVSLNGRLRGAHEDQALVAVRAIDHRARFEARSGAGVPILHIDTHAGTLEVETTHNGQTTTVDAYHLPDGVQIGEAWVLLNGRRVERQALSVPVGPDGDSMTYGFTMHSQGQDGDTTTSAVLVAGVSGQFTVFDDEKDVHDILEAVTGHDPD